MKGNNSIMIQKIQTLGSLVEIYEDKVIKKTLCDKGDQCDRKCQICTNNMLTELFILSKLKKYNGFAKLLDYDIRLCTCGRMLTEITQTNNGTQLDNKGIDYIIQNAEKILNFLVENVNVMTTEGIFHCDIKLSNIVVDDKDRMTLIDFSHSHFLKGIHMSSVLLGTYMPKDKSQRHNPHNINVFQIKNIGEKMIALINKYPKLNLSEKIPIIKEMISEIDKRIIYAEAGSQINIAFNDYINYIAMFRPNDAVYNIMSKLTKEKELSYEKDLMPMFIISCIVYDDNPLIYVREWRKYIEKIDDLDRILCAVRELL